MAAPQGVAAGVLLLLVVAVFSQYSEGKKFSAALFGDNKIVGGIRAKKYAFMVALLDATNEDLVCGGSAIDEWTVLSAGHCVDSLKLENARVRAGSVFYLIGGVVRMAARLIVHPKYDAKSDDYDAGIVRLKEALTKSVKPIALPRTSRGARPRDGTKLTTTGWGMEKWDENVKQPYSPSLKQTSLSIISQGKCAQMYKSENRTVTARMICATSPGTDDCKGDSGGPLFDAKTNTIYGVVSWGRNCADPRYPGVFVDLTNQEINTWVRKNMGNK